MAERGSTSPISETEYEAIEAAVMETARGRWFLAEFARRNRNADTLLLLEAIGRLEQTIAGERIALGMDRLRFELLEIVKAIGRAPGEIAAIYPAMQEHGRAGAPQPLDMPDGQWARALPEPTASRDRDPATEPASERPDPPAAHAPDGERPAAAPCRLDTIAAIDALDLREKLRRFT